MLTFRAGAFRNERMHSHAKTATVLSTRGVIRVQPHGKIMRSLLNPRGVIGGRRKRWKRSKKAGTEGGGRRNAVLQALLLTRKRNNSHRDANRTNTQNSPFLVYGAVSTAIFVPHERAVRQDTSDENLSRYMFANVGNSTSFVKERERERERL